jgi:uncharacterized protein YciI
MQYFVRGVDNAAVTEQLDLLAETHWAYMDGYVDSLVARGPTLSPDGRDHTGSVHVLDASSTAEAQRFAFGEPYWLADVYASVTITRFQNALTGTMWDRPTPPRGSVSSLVVLTWQARPFAPAADTDAQILRRLAETDILVFGGLLVCDEAASSVGLAAAFDADADEASAIVARIILPEPTAAIMTCRWQRGGRSEE